MMDRAENLFIKDERSEDDVASDNVINAYRKGISADECAKYYSDWATYEQDLNADRYKGPQIAADTVLKYLNSNKSAEILDVAAGTGFVGQKLREFGYTHIDALDPSNGMLKLAQMKKIYRRYIQDYIGDKRTDIENDVYDCLTIAGGMGEGHVPLSALKEMVRVVKPGGYIIIVMRQEFMTTAEEYRDKLVPCMARMEGQGQWTRQETTIYKNYFLDKNGIAFVYKVLDPNLQKLESVQ